jgi:acyl dehydratase
LKLNESLVGTSRPGTSLLVTRSRLRLFAKATGNTNPIFVDVEAAQRAGHRDLPVPPTFYFSVDLEAPEPFGYLDKLGIDLRAVLHGSQEFEYHAQAWAGDGLASSSTVVDVYEKRGGELNFMVTDTKIVNQDDQLLVTMRNTLIVRRLAGVNV